MIEEKLKSLGLSDNEIKVYLCVLENTKITPALVARKTGVSRPTAYGVGKSLADKGFIEMDELSPTLYFLALPPENVSRVVRKEKLELEEKMKIAEELVKDLSLIPRSKNYSIPKIKFIDDIDFESFLYKEAENWNKSGVEKDGTWWGFQDHKLMEEYSEWYKWYFKISAGKIQTKPITNLEELKTLPSVIDKNYVRQSKYWAGAEEIKNFFGVIGDYTVIANARQRPHYLVEIKDAALAENLRQVFKGLWEMLP